MAPLDNTLELLLLQSSSFPFIDLLGLLTFVQDPRLDILLDDMTGQFHVFVLGLLNDRLGDHRLIRDG